MLLETPEPEVGPGLKVQPAKLPVSNPEFTIRLARVCSGQHAIRAAAIRMGASRGENRGEVFKVGILVFML